jgi:YidC/Oxa1 family membrane protein insertase
VTLKHRLARLAPILLLVAIALIVVACTGPGGSPGASGATPTPSQAPLRPASPGANPVDLLSWLFTPIFQAFFIALVLIDQVTHNIAISIVLLTVLIRALLWPVTRRQLVSSKQMQRLQPEVKELQRRYKGDRVKQQAAVQEFYKQRGINPASGCLPLLLQFALLIPIYSVFSQGLTNHNVNEMLNVFGVQLLSLDCPAAPLFNAAGQVTNPCLNPIAFGVNWSVPEPQTTGLAVAGFGISILAIISSLVQLVASRQTLTPPDPKNDDPTIKTQRQMAYFLPLISILYGGALPAGLFLYWILGTALQVGQQFLIIGWGGMFPLFGWHPEFARNHTPRYPVPHPVPRPPDQTQKKGAAERPKPVDRSISAQSTIRPNRTRGGRRGRRR